MFVEGDMLGNSGVSFTGLKERPTITCTKMQNVIIFRVLWPFSQRWDIRSDFEKEDAQAKTNEQDLPQLLCYYY